MTFLLLALSLLPAGLGAEGPALPDPVPSTAEQQVPEEFRVLTGSRVAVHYLPPDSARAHRAFRFLEEQAPLPALPPDLPRSARYYLAPTPEVFDSLTGGRIPEWGAGVAFPREAVVVIPTYARDSRIRISEARVLRHEWAHLGLHQHLEGLQIPRWFDEGYAQWAAGWDASEAWRLRVSLLGGSTPELDSLTLAWPRGRAAAEVAYLLSATALEYLVESSGERGVRLLLDRWKEGESFDAAFRSVYGVTLGQFEEDWRNFVKRRYGWLLMLSRSVIFWLFLGLLLLVMVWIRKRRDREAMARLRATEPPEDPPFWNSPAGDPDLPAEAPGGADGKPGPLDPPVRGG